MFAATFQSNTVLQDYPIQDPKENHICVDIDKVLDAPETIDTVYQQDISINICSDRCSSLLQECTKAGSLEDGKVIHGRLIKSQHARVGLEKYNFNNSCQFRFTTESY
ncbi:hypothetical protein SUGI_0562890 [Cryptomeria japonica]|nr:hypothetical protein SUGI_0562890 [Cryptomeria japonica]